MLGRLGKSKNTEEFDDGVEVDCGLIVVDRGALRAAVGEQLLLGSVPGPSPCGPA
jgi:hypothetical protein